MIYFLHPINPAGKVVTILETISVVTNLPNYQAVYSYNIWILVTHPMASATTFVDLSL